MPDYKPNADFIVEVGRIPRLRPEIDDPAYKDNSGTISNQLKKRMSVVDLIPCQFETAFSSVLESANLKEAFKPKIVFGQPIHNYKMMCMTYGLVPSDFLRVYLTDMAQSQDALSNQYSKNVLDSTLESITESKVGKLFSSIFRARQSMGMDEKGLVDSIDATAHPSFFTNMATLAETVVTHGARISFPKIWSGSSYSPSLVCTVRLVSPYGHPEAISKFIIEPLGYLLILLAPYTDWGLVSYRPNYIALKSYGMTDMPICSPSNLEIRRGGDDSSFNIFKQPMTLDIVMTFETVTEGFGVFRDFGDPENTGDDFHAEKDIFLRDYTTKDFSDEFETDPSALFPTVKNIVNSLRPFGKPGEQEGGGVVIPTLRDPMMSMPGMNEFGGGVEPVESLPQEYFEYSSFKDSTRPSISIVYPEHPFIWSPSETDPGYVEIEIDDKDPVFEVVINPDDKDPEITPYDPKNFTPTDTFYELIPIDNKYRLKFSEEFNPNNVNFSLAFRLIRFDGLPGEWSDPLYFPNDIQNLFVDIIPPNLIIDKYLRWTVTSPTEFVYGPYIYGATIPSGDYLLKVIDMRDDIVLYVEDIFVTGDIQIKEVFIEMSEGSLLVNFIIPSKYKIDAFRYSLVSSGETNLVDGKHAIVIASLPEGFYYLNVSYMNQEIFYDDDVVIKEIKVDGNNLNTYDVTINDSLKITSIVKR